MDDLLDNAPCGYLSFRDDGRIVNVNKTLGDWLGYDPPALAGLNIDTVLTLSSRIFYNTHFFPLIRLHSKADEIFFSLMRKNRQDIPVLCNAVRRADKEAFLNHCIFMQVPQRKKYEEEILLAKRSAEEALRKNEDLAALSTTLESRTRELDNQFNRLLTINKNLMQFSKIVSHDLQEPIQKIQLFTSMLEGEETDENRRSTLAKIRTAAGGLKQLTAGLDEFIRVDTEKVYRPVRLNDVLKKAKLKAIENEDFKDFTLVTEPLPVVDGFEAQLVLLFYHLIDNSIQFRERSQKLVITVTATILKENVYRATPDKYQYTDHVRIVYTDNGMGFENKYHEYVFDLVKKVDPKSKGLGIGLSLAKKIVDNHSGSISARSDIGKGTAFTILLPLHLK
jgi:sigma-B regulation protein RsbU (phosphoserine phosphatase)